MLQESKEENTYFIYASVKMLLKGWRISEDNKAHLSFTLLVWLHSQTDQEVIDHIKQNGVQVRWDGGKNENLDGSNSNMRESNGVIVFTARLEREFLASAVSSPMTVFEHSINMEFTHF